MYQVSDQILVSSLTLIDVLALHNIVATIEEETFYIRQQDRVLYSLPKQDIIDYLAKKQSVIYDLFIQSINTLTEKLETQKKINIFDRKLIQNEIKEGRITINRLILYTGLRMGVEKDEYLLGLVNNHLKTLNLAKEQQEPID